MSDTPINQPNEHLARSFFAHSDIFQSLMEFYLPPKTSKLLAFDSFHPIDTNMKKDYFGKIQDYIGYRGTFTNGISVFMFLEPQSAIDGALLIRMLHYITITSTNYITTVDQSKQSALIPFPIAVTFYYGKAPWTGRLKFSEMWDNTSSNIDPDILKFVHDLIDLNCTSVKIGKGHPFLQSLLIVLKAYSLAKPIDNESLSQLGKIMASAKTDSRIKNFTAEIGRYILEFVKVAGGPAVLEELFFIPILGKAEGKKMLATTIDAIKATSAK
ncbi:MAG: Rpn family recombination-promoting nuclease/putative transposase [Planctomycetota bacterium]|jgi:hypothetical protein|nr:Rpn family recombination-promoting nuclease/putative transposase [Planctomycetota bacterium]